MLDHVGLRVANMRESRRFFTAALQPLGYAVLMEFGEAVVGFGTLGKPDFWISHGTPSAPVHVAFTSADRQSVEAFHAAALAAGGRENGAPGLRPQYHPHYYGAFVLDPDGNNIEAVCHAPM